MADTNGHVKQLDIILPESYYARVGKKQFSPMMDASLQRRATESPVGGIYSWWFSRYDDGSELAPWWSPQRDIDLRWFVMREGNDILQGAVSSMVKWGKTLAWVLEGPDRVTNKFQSMLSESEFGEGWGTLISKALYDYYTQDKGATIEIIGKGKPDGPLEGPVLGLAHLDSQFVQPTGDPVYPILYHNMKGEIEGGTYHKIHASRVIRIVDMPSPNEFMCGIGFCAVSRVIASSQILLKLARYKNEKLSDLPEAGLLILNNILPHQWDDAKADHQRGRRKLGHEIWSNIMTLHSVDPARPAEANLISFANLPDGFNELEATNLYVNIVALAFGVDSREFWPITSGAFGGSREAEVQSEKSKGKGKGDIIAAFERAINWKVLPESVSFRFDFKDDQEDKLKGEINKEKVESIMRMWDSESYRAGLLPPISALELRQMLADNVPDYFKQDFIKLEAVTDEEELTDTEREEKQYSNADLLLDMAEQGQFPNANILLTMVEENYKSGKISLDQLLEFRIGQILDEHARV